jgi:hypothetical protein
LRRRFWQRGRLAEVADKPCPVREAVIADAISKAELILRKIERLYPPEE